MGKTFGEIRKGDKLYVRSSKNINNSYETFTVCANDIMPGWIVPDKINQNCCWIIMSGGDSPITFSAGSLENYTIFTCLSGITYQVATSVSELAKYSKDILVDCEVRTTKITLKDEHVFNDIITYIPEDEYPIIIEKYGNDKGFIEKGFFNQQLINKLKRELCDKIMNDPNPFEISIVSEDNYPVEYNKTYKLNHE